MKKLACALALLVAACGGGGSKGNPASGTTFDYSTGTQTGSTQTGASVAATAGALTKLTAFDETPGSGRAADVSGSLLEAADLALGGGFSLSDAPRERVLPLLRSTRDAALALGDLPGSGLPLGCGTITNGANLAVTITFDPAVCTITDTSTPGTTVTAKLGGHVSRLALGVAEWDLRIDARIQDASLDMTLGLTDSGHSAVTLASATGHEEAAFGATVRFPSVQNAPTYTLGMAQSADLAVSLDPSCLSGRIVGGTFEAKRVWTAVPGELRDSDPETYRARGVKITWAPGCGAGATGVLVVR